jgi:signal transduction histidine kinase
VDDTLKLLGDRFLREVEVKFNRAAGLPKIAIARDFVQQVLLNIIFNAAEAMTDRKQISLSTQWVESAPTGIILSPARSDSCIAIAVKDSGSGIAPENLPRIFEPFFTTKAMSARRGTGLGLSMVYELAKKLEAGLAVETVVGAGSTFTIFLPVKTETARLVQSEIEMRS